MFSWLFGNNRELQKQLEATRAELAVIKAASTGELVLSGGDGFSLIGQHQNLARAAEQLASFRGWPFACVHAIASRIAGQAVRLGRRASSPFSQRGLGKSFSPPGFQVIENHSLLDLLADPNELQVAWSLWYVTVASLELTGRCLWYAPEGESQILPLPTSWLVGFNGSTKFESFRVRPPSHSEEFTIPADEACYFFYPHPCDPRESASPLQAAALAVAADDEIQRSQVAGFKNGIFPRHLITLAKGASPDGSKANPVNLTGAQREQLLSAVRSHYAGAAKSGQPLIVGDALIESVAKLSATPEEMDWSESSKLTKARICQIFGVNPIILGEIESANRASSLAAEEHLAGTLNPKLRLLGDTITEWLCPRFGDGLKCWFEPYVPRDFEAELKRYDLLARYSAIEVNELRQWAGLPAVDYGDVPVSAGGSLDSALAGMVDQRFASLGAEQLFAAPAELAKRMNGHTLTN